MNDRFVAASTRFNSTVFNPRFFWVEATAVKTGREFEAICGMEPISENPKDRAWYEALGLPDQ